MLILRSQPKKPLTKTIMSKVNAQGEEYYDVGQYNQKIMRFSGREVPITSFDELVSVLDNLSDDMYSCIVRGALIHGTNPDSFYRRKTTNPKEGCIEDVDQQWVCLDIDGIPLHSLGCTLEESPKVIQKMLPTCFAKASCWWNFSASQGFKDGNKVSLHMWFWLDDEISNAELKRYFTLFNESFEEVYGIKRFVDPILFDQIQIHYTAPPDLINIKDPIKQRKGINVATNPTVKITEEWIRDSKMDEGAISKHLERVGDDKDGFHSPLLSASAAWVRTYGLNEATRNEFKMIARDTIARSDTSRHDEEQMKRYLSDSFLDKLLDSAQQKGFDSKAVIVDMDSRKFFSGYVFCEMSNKFFKKSSSDFVDKGSFDLVARPVLKMANGTKTFIDAGGDIVDNAISIPGEEAMSVITWQNKKVYNKWRGRIAVKLLEYDASPWEKHISFLCDDRKDVTDTLLDYLAYIITHPGEKVNWCPIIGSQAQGTGKSMIKVVLEQIYAENGVSEIGTEDIRNQFNQFMESELVLVEEVYGPDNRAMVNQLKAKLTEKTVMINIKNVPQYKAPNFANFIMFTNYSVPFPMDAGDRRFMMIYSHRRPQPQEYYNKLLKWLESAGDIVYSWAMDRDLSKFDRGRAPMVTAEKAEVVSSSRNSIDELLYNGIENSTWPFQHDVVMLEELAIRITGVSKYEVSVAKIGMALKSLNVTTVSGIKKIDGRRKRFTLAIVRDVEKYTKMSDSDLFDVAVTNIIGERRDYYELTNM